MKKNRVRHCFRMVCLFVGLALLAGCDTEFTVSVDRFYENATVQIDFIKIQRGDTRWASKDPEDYFTPGDPLREEALLANRIYEMHHNVPNRGFRGKIGPDSAAWRQFGYDGGEPDFDIFVMVDAPSASTEANLDYRKRLIPLDRASWDRGFLSRLLGGNKLELSVQITPAGVLLDPAPRGS